MDTEQLKFRALDLIVDSMNDFAATAKLQFGLSTGAIVLFVHMMADSHDGPLLVGILTLASAFFGISAILCIRALIHWSVLKTKMALAFATILSGSDEPPGDVFLRIAKEEIEGAKTKFGRMAALFDVGVVWSILFLLAQFVLRFHR
jgi:hypothetical protein